MLRLKYLYENFDLAKFALENWEYDADTLARMLAQYRISSNAVYPYTQNGEVRFLRLAPEEEKLERNVRGEMEFLAYLKGKSYPALFPIPAKTGELFLKLETPWGAYYACAFARVKGQSLEETPLTPEIARACGKALGRLHALSAQYRPECPKWTHEDALVWISDAFTACGAGETEMAELAHVRGALSALEKTPENYGLTHYDFEPDNVFYCKETGAVSPIDFEDGMYHFFALDVDIALSHLDESPLAQGILPEEARAEFLRGYAGVYPFPPEAEASRPLMRRFARLYAHARVLRSASEPVQDGEPAWMTGLRARLDGMLQNNIREMRADAQTARA